MSKRVSKQLEDAKQGAKKLRKREHRLRQRLEEAQKHYESALVRLRRAEVRLQKRQERVERLQSRLSLLQGQVQPSTIITSESVPGADVERVEITLVEPETTEANLEISPSEEALLGESEAEQDVNTPQSIIGSFVSVESINPASLAEEEPVDLLESEQSAETFPEQEGVLPAQNLTPLFSTEEQEQLITPEAVKEPIVQTEEEFQDAPEPVSNNLRLALIREACAVSETATQAAGVAIMRTSYMLAHLEQMLDGCFLLQDLAQLQSETTILSSLARDARKIVEALLSQQTAVEVFTSLAQEVEQQQQALGLIRMNIDFPLDGSTSVAPLADDVTTEKEPVSLASSDDDELNLYEEEIIFDLPATLFSQSISDQEPPEEVSDNAEARTPPFSLATIEKVAEAGRLAAGLIREEPDATSSSPANAAQGSRLDEEEKEVETVAAMLVADAAAAAAAEAEALAEASSLQTRNASTAATQADLVLEQIRIALQRGVLSDAEARSALQIAERSATEAHTALADAEATEAQAISAAINAEAEAEVAEGMALSVHDRAEGQESQSSRASLHFQHPEQTDEYLMVSDAELNLAINRLAADEEEIQAQIFPYQELV